MGNTNIPYGTKSWNPQTGCGDVLSPKLTDDGKVYFYCIGCDVDYYVDKRVYHPEEVKP